MFSLNFFSSKKSATEVATEVANAQAAAWIAEAAELRRVTKEREEKAQAAIEAALKEQAEIQAAEKAIVQAASELKLVKQAAQERILAAESLIDLAGSSVRTERQNLAELVKSLQQEVAGKTKPNLDLPQLPAAE